MSASNTKPLSSKLWTLPLQGSARPGVGTWDKILEDNFMNLGLDSAQHTVPGARSGKQFKQKGIKAPGRQ